jgi:hypothetical protein
MKNNPSVTKWLAHRYRQLLGRKSGRTGRANRIPRRSEATPQFCQPLEPRVLLSASISGQVWLDANVNSVYDVGETLQSGIMVHLLSTDVNQVTTEVDAIATDDSGQYSFTISDVSKLYQVQVDLPAAYVLSLQDQGANDALDSDLNQATHTSVPQLLTESANVTHIDAGLVSQLTGNLTLSNLGSTYEGVTLNGLIASDYAGWSVDYAGDVNGDGYDDLLIGAYGVDNAIWGLESVGEVYLVYGEASGWDTGSFNPTDLLNNNKGVVFQGGQYAGTAGYDVATAGDVNGDGLDDYLISAKGEAGLAGNTYLIYGQTGADERHGTFALNTVGTVGGIQGAVFTGEAFSQSGNAVSTAGDVNGDGYDDLLIGAVYTDSNDINESGAAYLIYGSSTAITGSYTLATISQSLPAATFYGSNELDHVGYAVAGGGDVNGDGYDDILITVQDAANSKVGKAYLVYGQAMGQQLVGDIALSSVGNTVEGAVISGIKADDNFGSSAAIAGDVNNDGYDDILIGAEYDYNGTAYNQNGAVYLIMGSQTLLSGTYTSDDIGDTVSGYHFVGAVDGGRTGHQVQGVGDVNGDGIDDFALSADWDNSSGRTYLIYGVSGQWDATTINLSDLNVSYAGAKFAGFASNDNVGSGLASAGDINGDGLNDLFIGAYKANANFVNDTGQAYLILGQGTPTLTYESSIWVETLDNAVRDGNESGVAGITVNLLNLSDQIVASGITDPLGNYVIDHITPGDYRLQIDLPDSYFLTYKDHGTDDSIDNDFDPTTRMTDVLHFSLESPPTNIHAGLVKQLYGEYDMATLGTIAEGATFHGTDTGNLAGFSVDFIGDINGDGFDDMLISSNYTTNNYSEVYLIYGIGGALDVAHLSRQDLIDQNIQGAILSGVTRYSNISDVSKAGDVNGDGLDDFLIGDPNAGVYLIYGQTGDSLLLGEHSLTEVGIENGIAGAIFNRTNISFSSGMVSHAGDVNQDGYDDFLISAEYEQYDTMYSAGVVRLVYGQATGIEGNIALKTLTDNPDIQSAAFYGNEADIHLGYAIAGGGDLNADGYDDLLISARNSPNPDSDGEYNYEYTQDTGTVFIIYGQGNNHQLLGDINIASIGDTSIVDGGYTIDGASIGSSNKYNYFGSSLAFAGDVNHDGYEDFLIGAQEEYTSTTNPDSDSGAAYLILGSNEALVGTYESAQIGDTSQMGKTINGYEFYGENVDSNAGITVSGVGDVNGDGIDDFAIGAQIALTGSVYTGNVYLIYGSEVEWTDRFTSLSQIGSIIDGAVFNGIANNDRLGSAMASAGDFNGDAINDILVGAYYAHPLNGLYYNAGSAYLILGQGMSTYSIDGTVWIDQDHNGLRDLDAPYAGLTVNLLDGQGNVINTMLSEADGSYAFESLLADDYYVQVVLPINYTYALKNIGEDDSIDSDMNLSSGVTDVIHLTTNATNVDAGVVAQLNGSYSLADVGNTTSETAIDGTTFNGTNEDDFVGEVVTSAGDVNGDGFDDMLIGARSADRADYYTDLGAVYLVYGSDSDWDWANVNLDDLVTAGKAAVFYGEPFATHDNGIAISAAGDINEDGLADFIFQGYLNGTAVPRNYLVYGQKGSNQLIGTHNVSEIGADGGVQGAVFNGTTAVNNGYTLQAGGDFNGDGHADLILAAPTLTTAVIADTYSAIYVIYGDGTAIEGSIDLNTQLASLASVSFLGTFYGSNLGLCVSAGQDVNGDGVDDLLFTAHEGSSGYNFLIYGQSRVNQLAGDILVATGSVTSNGQAVASAIFQDNTGSVSSFAGDVNGDGYADMLIGAPNWRLGTYGYNNGKTYLILGQPDTQPLTGSHGVSSIGTTVAGYTFQGIAIQTYSGSRTTALGDVNGDGLDDFAITCKRSNNYAGEVYLVYGSSTGWDSSALLLADLGTTYAGATFHGASAGNYAGIGLGAAGDVNGDGLDDLFIGAYRAFRADNVRTGQAYVILGQGAELIPTARVVNRQIFYNDSYFDGNGATVEAADFNAIAPDKVALLPGQTAGQANYTNYRYGINGIMIDVRNIPDASVLSVNDFEFKVGNTTDPSSWGTAPAATLTVFLGAGDNGSDRLVLTWADQSITHTWLQVRMLANTRTNLEVDDIFYFGNAVGETYNDTGNTDTNIFDISGAWSNLHGTDVADITDRFDVNKDGAVNIFDISAMWSNLRGGASALNMDMTALGVVSPLALADGYTPSGEPVESVSETELPGLIEQALALWQGAGISDAAISMLQQVNVQVVNLSGSLLGLASDGTIWIDDDAAGMGWFVDRTPQSNEEFRWGNDVWTATEDGSAAGKVDLLTVLAHEYGHVLGLADVEAQPVSNDLMTESLMPGVRRSVSNNDLLQPLAIQTESLASQSTLAQQLLSSYALALVGE